MTLSTHTRRQLSYAEGYLALGLKCEAAEALAEIISAERDTTPVVAMGLAVHTERGEWARAGVLGAILCEREPHIAGFWIQWAYAIRRHDGLVSAKEILMRGLGLHPKEAVIHFNLACYAAQLGHLADARVFLDTACGLDAEFVDLAKNDNDLVPLRQVAI